MVFRCLNFFPQKLSFPIISYIIPETSFMSFSIQLELEFSVQKHFHHFGCFSDNIFPFNALIFLPGKTHNFNINNNEKQKFIHRSRTINKALLIQIRINLLVSVGHKLVLCKKIIRYFHFLDFNWFSFIIFCVLINYWIIIRFLCVSDIWPCLVKSFPIWFWEKF